MMSRATLLLLEDDLNLSDTICEFLEEQGFSVVCAYDGDEAADLVYEKQFDLLLLDVNVPGTKGFELLKSIRESENRTPAMFITSLDGLEDLEEGYESGCDDYIRKPFALKELLLRVETLIKREFGHVNSEKVAISQEIYFDTAGNTLHVKDERYQLQNKEAILLKLFLKRRVEVISHDVLLETLWGYDETPSDTALRTYIKNLRKYLGKESIVSLKKMGYKFTSE